MFSLRAERPCAWVLGVFLLSFLILPKGDLFGQSIFDTVWEINKASLQEVEAHATYLRTLGFSGVALSIAPLEQHIGYSGAGDAVRSVSGCQQDYSAGFAGPSFINRNEGGCDSGKIENVNPEYLNRFRDKQNVYRAAGLEIVLLPLWARDWVAELTKFYGTDLGSLRNGVGKYCAALNDLVIDPLDPPKAILFGGDYQSHAAHFPEHDTITLWEACKDELPDNIKLGYHTGAWNDPRSELIEVFGQSKPEWLNILALQTGHSNASPSHVMLKVGNWLVGGELWSGESQYRDIDIVGNGTFVSAEEVKNSSDDLVCANRNNQAGISAYFYGHNARWQWINASHPQGDYPVGYSSTAASSMLGKNMSDEYKLVKRWKRQQCCELPNNSGHIDCDLNRVVAPPPPPPPPPIDTGDPDVPDYPLVFNPPVFGLPEDDVQNDDYLTFNNNSLFGQGAIQNTSIEPEIQPVSMTLEHFAMYPEPFAQDLRVEFQVSNTVSAKLGLYDLLGSLVEEIDYSTIHAGRYVHDFSNLDLAPGKYIVHVQIDSESATRLVTKL